MVHKKTWQRDQRWLEHVIVPAWRDVPVAELRRQETQRLLDKVANPAGRNARSSARSIKLLLSKMFNFALPRDYGIEFNPVQGVQTLPGGRRTRNLTDPEIAKLLTALDAESEAGLHRIAHWFLLILLTAQRPGEVATMQWAGARLGCRVVECPRVEEWRPDPRGAVAGDRVRAPRVPRMV
jgi:integrase